MTEECPRLGACTSHGPLFEASYTQVDATESATVCSESVGSIQKGQLLFEQVLLVSIPVPYSVISKRCVGGEEARANRKVQLYGTAVTAGIRFEVVVNLL